MSLIVAEVYEALIEAGASKEKAKAAASAIPLVERLATREVVASLEKEMATKTDIANSPKADIAIGEGHEGGHRQLGEGHEGGHCQLGEGHEGGHCPPGQSRNAHGQETRGTQSSGPQLYPGCPDAVGEARFLPVGRISEA